MTAKPGMRGARASSAPRSIEIDAPVDEVFSFLADPVKTMEAMKTLGRVVVSDVKTNGEGAVTSWTWNERFRMLPFTVHAGVTRHEHVPNRRIVEKHSTGPVCTYTLQPLGERTRLTYTIELARPFVLLVKIQALLTTKGKGVGNDMDEFLLAIKKQLEA